LVSEHVIGNLCIFSLFPMSLCHPSIGRVLKLSFPRRCFHRCSALHSCRGCRQISCEDVDPPKQSGRGDALILDNGYRLEHHDSHPHFFLHTANCCGRSSSRHFYQYGPGGWCSHSYWHEPCAAISRKAPGCLGPGGCHYGHRRTNRSYRHILLLLCADPRFFYFAGYGFNQSVNRPLVCVNFIIAFVVDLSVTKLNISLLTRFVKGFDFDRAIVHPSTRMVTISMVPCVVYHLIGTYAQNRQACFACVSLGKDVCFD